MQNCDNICIFHLCWVCSSYKAQYDNKKQETGSMHIMFMHYRVKPFIWVINICVDVFQFVFTGWYERSAISEWTFWTDTIGVDILDGHRLEGFARPHIHLWWPMLLLCAYLSSNWCKINIDWCCRARLSLLNKLKISYTTWTIPVYILLL